MEAHEARSDSLVKRQAIVNDIKIAIGALVVGGDPRGVETHDGGPTIRQVYAYDNNQDSYWMLRIEQFGSDKDAQSFFRADRLMVHGAIADGLGERVSHYMDADKGVIRATVASRAKSKDSVSTREINTIGELKLISAQFDNLEILAPEVAEEVRAREAQILMGLGKSATRGWFKKRQTPK